MRSDLGVKIFGDDLAQLLKSGNEIAAVISSIEGAEGVKVEQVSGLPILSVEANRPALYRYGLNVEDVQDVLAAATGGEEAGLIDRSRPRECRTGPARAPSRPPVN